MRIQGHAFATALAVGVLAGACWAADSTPARPAAEAAGAQDEPAKAAIMAETHADRPLTLARPVTLRLALPDALLAAVRGLRAGEAARPTLRLTLVELARPRAEVKVRVFVNHPGASAASPIDGPGYVGEVGFHPTTATTPGAETMPDSTFLLDLGPALAALPPAERLVEGRFVDVTLVAVPLRDGPPPPAEVEIPFRGVRLSLHEGG
jgi:hypothetical protein